MVNNVIIGALPPSWMSLYIEMLFNNTILAKGTSFIIEHNSTYFLITNRHNVRGRNNYTNKLLPKHGGIPNKIRIYFNKKNETGMKGKWIKGEIELYRNPENESTFIWHEHPP